MCGKIVFKNVVKNIKDYGIYFLTLFISVGVFYAFNSIESQPAIEQMRASGNGMTGQIVSMIGLVSKFVAVMLAFLIIYANNFLVKRRKKEMGIYMILGMPESKISLMFVGETILIGILAMVGGIGLGCVLSQGISIIALRMFAYDLASFVFSFSMASLKETIICFTIIYVLVALFNIRTISKVKIIDMINAARKNEKMIVSNTILQVIIILAAVVLYVLVAILVYQGKALNPTSKQSAIAIVSLCVATAMLIYGAAGVILNLLRKSKGWYLKNVNAFFIRQISSKVQTNYMTMTVVSLLLTGTICIISIGMGMADSMNQAAKAATPYDVVVMKEGVGDLEQPEDFYQELVSNGLDLDNALNEWAVLEICKDDGVTFEQILSRVDTLAQADIELPHKTIDIISISDYNKALEAQGKSPIDMENGTYLINSNYKGTNELIQEQYEKQQSLVIGGMELLPGSTEVFHNTYYLSVVGLNDKGTIIVDDQVADVLQKTGSLLVGNYAEGYDNTSFEKMMIQLMGNAVESPINYMTKDLICETYYSMFAILAFICSYIGVILLIICVAVLSLQQLTETNDNVVRYQILNKVGVDEKMCKQTLLRQIMVYFGVPLVIGVSYSIVALPKIVDKINNMLGMDIGAQVIYLVIILIAVYGSYFILTYMSCSKMIEEKSFIAVD